MSDGVSDGPTRIAILGCGFIGTVHSYSLRSLIGGGLADAVVVSACDVDVDRARATLDAHGPGRATDDLDQALEGVDAAWVCTPTAMHRQVVERCVAHGVAIYCEKPLAKNLASALEIFRMVDEAGLPNQVGLVLRYAPPFSALASICQGQPVVGAPGPEVLGRPIASVLRDDQFFPIGGMYRSTWRGDVDVAGGGTLIEHSIHDVDALSWMFGPVVSVTARTQNNAGHPGIEDVAAVTFAHSSGAISTLLSVWHGLESRPSTRRLEVFFEKAHVVLENEQLGPVMIEHAGGPTDLGISENASELMNRLPVPDALRPQILAYAGSDLAFLAALAGGFAPEPGLAVAVEAHRVVEAAYRSAALGGEPLILAECD
ncbi:MAG: Gfo/Idh/MocA family oxidoreductase [Acidimicrobiales bacterium]